MKLFVKILLLVLTFSTVAFAQTKAKTMPEKIFVEYSTPEYEDWIRLQISTDTNSNERPGSFGGANTPKEEGKIEGYLGNYSLVKLLKNSAIVNFEIKLNFYKRKSFSIKRNIFIRKDEVVEITFKNGIKVRAYFESAENIIKQGEIINNAENR